MKLRIAVVAALVGLASTAEARMCPSYAAVAEDSPVFRSEDVERWTTYALRMEGAHDDKSPCYVYVNINLQQRADTRLWYGQLTIQERRYITKSWAIVGRQVGMIVSFGEYAIGNVANEIRQHIERFVSSEIRQTDPLPDEPVIISESELSHERILAKAKVILAIEAAKQAANPQPPEPSSVESKSAPPPSTRKRK